MRGLVILGSTGSIGRQTLDVVRAFPDEFQIIGLAGGFNLKLLAEQAEEFKPRFICCASQTDQHHLPKGMPVMPMEEMVCHPDVELVMTATTGRAGLVPTNFGDG